MGRRLLFLEAVVKDGERAFLIRDGRFERVLEPGAHRIFDPTNSYEIEVFNVVGTSLPMDRIRVLQSIAPDVVRRYFEVIDAEQDEIVFILLDGVTRFYATHRNPMAFWTCVTRVELERLSLKDSLRAEPELVDRHGMARSALVVDEQVESHEAALLSIDGVLVERLSPGRHTYWQHTHKVAIRKFDLRARPLEITAQEILTKDRVAVRVTLTAFWRIVDPERAARAAEDLPNLIYRLIQFAIRNSVVTRSLDEILGARDTLEREVQDFVAPRAPDMGISIDELGMKDVILPGDVRALLNKVLEAERLARANLIRRQEETAATRSLLNTARLMENNPIVLRLKELESLEKLVEKVGRIELTAGPGVSGFEPLLKHLFRLDAGAADQAPEDRRGGD